MKDFDLYYFKAISEVEKIKAKRSYNERTIFDWKGKKMRRKLERGYISGVNSAIKVLKKLKKEFDLENENDKLENQEKSFIK